MLRVNNNSSIQTKRSEKKCVVCFVAQKGVAFFDS